MPQLIVIETVQDAAGRQVTRRHTDAHPEPCPRILKRAGFTDVQFMGKLIEITLINLWRAITFNL